MEWAGPEGEKQIMKLTSRLVAMLAVLCLVAWGAPVASAASADRIGDVRVGAEKVRIDGKNGKDRYRAVTPRTKVYLVNRAGERRAADVNQLARGAKILGKRVDGRELVAVTLAATATGNSDCSFDTSDEDGDDVSADDSFDCSSDYDDDTLDTDTDCSYDSSSDGPSNDWSMDASWDCSYSETDDSDEEDGGLDWDCSFSASAGGSSDADGGDSDADLDFDCSWNGAETDSALWDCSFVKGAMGFECVSEQLDQSFGYLIDTADLSMVGGMDFQDDLVEDGEDGEGVNCDGTPSDGYDCSVDGEAGSGDCSADWDFDRSRGSREGDVSGSMSYSCSWDA